MGLRLSCAGSLPSKGESATYPFSHIRFWLERQLKLNYAIVGTGEPGWVNRFRMVERFTQDIDGVELRLVGERHKSFCVGRIRAIRRPEDAKEVTEAKYLASIAPDGILRKATITDPVTIGFELLVNNPQLFRTYPDIYEDLTKALEPIVRAVSGYVDIVQFDCPSHAARTTRDPWRYVNELAKATGKRTWIHIDGDVGFMFRTLIEEYDVDVLNVNLFGREGESNFEAIGKWGRMLRDTGKRLAPAIVNTQISDREEEIESIEMIRSRIDRLSSHLGFDILEAVTPGCGLALLPNAAQAILERLQATVQELG
jgi:methionine synthase II (cobalamin-independent)